MNKTIQCSSFRSGTVSQLPQGSSTLTSSWTCSDLSLHFRLAHGAWCAREIPRPHPLGLLYLSMKHPRANLPFTLPLRQSPKKNMGMSTFNGSRSRSPRNPGCGRGRMSPRDCLLHTLSHPRAISGEETSSLSRAVSFCCHTTSPARGDWVGHSLLIHHGQVQ